MADQIYDHIVVGGGLAGASAIEGIRERDEEGAILLLCREKRMPYHRPELSKKLWFGKKKVEDIFVYDEDFYMEKSVDVALGVEAIKLNVAASTISDSSGAKFGFERLLLATGGIPRMLDIPGGNLEGVCYFRYLDDYLRIRDEASEGKTAVVIGGGFIGSEIAAALNINKVDVTMIFREPYLVSRIFPESLGKAIQQDYVKRGVTMLAESSPKSIEKRGAKFVTTTDKGVEIESDMALVGVGISPEISLAAGAGLEVGNGIVVNDKLQTSKSRIYAAGDNAFFPYAALGKSTRIEHWDNALTQGKHAGLNMAGANQAFVYMPYFYSDLFDFGFEAVGEVDSKLDIITDWVEENATGVIYYLQEGRVRGAMLCNVWDKLDDARKIIKKGKLMTAEDLRGAITP